MTATLPTDGGERQDVAFVLQQHHAFRGQALRGFTSGGRRGAGLDARMWSIEQPQPEFQPQDVAHGVVDALSSARGLLATCVSGDRKKWC